MRSLYSPNILGGSHRVSSWLNISLQDLTPMTLELERKLGAHDQAIASILSAIQELMTLPEPPKKRRMGFIQDEGWAASIQRNSWHSLAPYNLTLNGRGRTR